MMGGQPSQDGPCGHLLDVRAGVRHLEQKLFVSRGDHVLALARIDVLQDEVDKLRELVGELVRTMHRLRYKAVSFDCNRDVFILACRECGSRISVSKDSHPSSFSTCGLSCESGNACRKAEAALKGEG